MFVNSKLKMPSSKQIPISKYQISNWCLGFWTLFRQPADWDLFVFCDFGFVICDIIPSMMPAPTPCKRMVSDLFHSPLGVLFTFPSRYLFTIGLHVYLALPVSTGRFTRAIHVSRYSGITTRKMYDFRVRGYYPLGPCFPTRSANHIFCNFLHASMLPLPYNPDPT